MTSLGMRARLVFGKFGGINGPKNRLAATVIIPTIIYYLLFRYWPVIQTLFLSVTDAQLLRKDYQFVGLDNYFFIFKDPHFVKAIWNTTIYAFITTIFTIILALILAYFLNPLPAWKQFHADALLLADDHIGHRHCDDLAVALPGKIWPFQPGAWRIWHFAHPLAYIKAMGVAKPDHHGGVGRGRL